MSALVIIPARMKATRLPGKPLALIDGVPMIVRVYQQAKKAHGVRVVVACGESEIADVVKQHGGEAVLTDPDLASGSDRIMAALEQIDPEKSHQLVINLQGDMPFVAPSIIDQTIDQLYETSHCDISTLVAPEFSPEDRKSPDVVKAILAQNGKALYFTRSQLYGDEPIWRHIGVYGYRRKALEAFTRSRPTPLECREKLEQLRALELGLNIYASKIEQAPISVDTPADLQAAIDFAQTLNQSPK